MILQKTAIPPIVFKEYGVISFDEVVCFFPHTFYFFLILWDCVNNLLLKESYTILKPYLTFFFSMFQ